MNTSRSLAMAHEIVGRPHLRVVLALGVAAALTGCSGGLPTPTRGESPSFAATAGAPTAAAAIGTPDAAPEQTGRRPRQTRAPDRPATGRAASTADPAGDVDGPRYADGLSLSASIQSSDLILQMRVGGVPTARGSEAVIYLFKLDLDDDGSEEYWTSLESRSDGSFYPVLFAIDASVDREGAEFPGAGAVDGRLVVLRLQLASLGRPGAIAFRGLIQRSIDSDVQSEDEVPDSPSRWLRVETSH
jgi:hypothetical protein